MKSYLCVLHTGATEYSGAYFGEGSGLIHLTFVNCSGSEYDLTECVTQNGSSHSLDVGVKCQPGTLMLSYMQCVYLSYILFFLYS